MSASLQQPDLDELGLPRLPPSQELLDMDDEEMKEFISSDLSGLDLPQPSSFPTPEKAQQEVRSRSTNMISDWE